MLPKSTRASCFGLWCMQRIFKKLEKIIKSFGALRNRLLSMLRLLQRLRFVRADEFWLEEEIASILTFISTQDHTCCFNWQWRSSY